MKFIQLKVLSITALVVVSSSLYLFAYDDETTHREINFYATVHCSNLDDILQDRFGLDEGIREVFDKKSIWEWIRDGGEREDDSTRPLRHFHDPLKEWNVAGLDIEGLTPFDSSLVAAQDAFWNHYSWPKARDAFYNALIYESTLPQALKPEYYYAKMFRSLGQIMHLVSDTAVPSHVRNDAHIGWGWFSSDLAEDMYEKWAEEHYDDGKVQYWENINYSDDGEIIYEFYKVRSNIFNDAKLTQSTEAWNNPITALWDQNIYSNNNPSTTWETDLGLAEFTNVNFFSQDTVFSEDYNYPDIVAAADETVPMEVIAEDGLWEKVLYVRHPEKGYRLATVTYFNGYARYRNFSFGKDDSVWQDYAAKLIPRAVGYSAALLNYFFRGNFDVSRTTFDRNSVGDLTGVSLMVRNASKLSEGSSEIETFSDGKLSIVCKYIPPGDVEYEYSLIENAYTVYGINDLINSEYVPIDKSFDDPIPLGATDISLTLVFCGKMGNETGAVAARVLKFTSRIAYSSQPGGAGSIRNIYSILPDGTDNRQITNAKEPNPWYYAPEWSSDGRLLAFNSEVCTIGTCDTDDHDREIWVIDRFSKESFPDNVVSTFSFWDPDNFTHPEEAYLLTFSFSPDGSRIVALATNTIFTGLVVYDVFEGTWEYIDSFDYWKYKILMANAPAWSPQEDTIAYCVADSRSDPKADIYLISPEGGEDMQLTDDEYNNTQPTWSADGEQILFVSNRDGGSIMDIWVMDRNGGNMQKIRDCEGNCSSPSFSPNGQQISFGMSGEIYTVNIDGSDIARVTDSGLATNSPSWSPWILEAPAP